MLFSTPPSALTARGSSSRIDVTGAKHFGFKVAWIRRAAPSASSGPIGPAQMYRLLRGNAETLGYRADYMVGALIDLIGLI